MVCLLQGLLSVDDSSFAHVIRANFDLDGVSGKNANVELSHSTADVSKDLLTILQFNHELGIWQSLSYDRVEDDLFLFGHEHVPKDLL
jgi:hypothetical protein